MMSEEINFDGDLVTFSFRGKQVELFAADEVAEIDDEIKARDAKIKHEDRGPGGLYPDHINEFGQPVPFTHGRGEAFKAILTEHFKSKHGLTVSPYTAWAMYVKLVEVKDKYVSFFVNGPSSRPPSDSLPPMASADEAAAALLSTTPVDSGPLSGSNSSTTESLTPKPESGT